MINRAMVTLVRHHIPPPSVETGWELPFGREEVETGRRKVTFLRTGEDFESRVLEDGKRNVRRGEGSAATRGRSGRCIRRK